MGEVSLKMRRFLLKDFLFKPFGETFVDPKIEFWVLQILPPLTEISSPRFERKGMYTHMVSTHMHKQKSQHDA